MALSITQTTQDKIPNLPFEKLHEMALGKKHDCSLVFIGDKRGVTLNTTYRNKDYIPNTLSFTYDENSGEIFINLREARRQYKKREESFDYFVALLFTHSCLHLKNHEHGDIMDEMTEKILAKAGIKNLHS
jgi:rRNA maturation RNase YbeY